MKRNKGYTLIELMIVIIIVGILAAIAIPPLMRYRENNETQSVEITIQQPMEEGKPNSDDGGLLKKL